MATVHEFELFHGIVLTKLMRSEHPITLRMIETKPSEAWSAYTLNVDAVDLFIKHSTTPRNVARGGGGKSWAFGFGIDQLKQMETSSSKRQVYVALVGGGRGVKDDMQVCLLKPDEIRELIDFNNHTQQALTVKHFPGKKLRVIKGREEKFLVSQNRLDEWQVPGS